MKKASCFRWAFLCVSILDHCAFFYPHSTHRLSKTISDSAHVRANGVEQILKTGFSSSHQQRYEVRKGEKYILLFNRLSSE